MNVPRSIFNSIFGGKNKQKQKDEDEDIRPPERRLSISKSGRMKVADKQRATITDGLFPPNQKGNVQVQIRDTQKQLNNNKIETNTRKSSFSDEDLDIDEVIREIQQTAL